MNNHAQSLAVGQVFTPGAPIGLVELFSGRARQLDQIQRAINQRGYHAILFGERGVGKTSLANILRIITPTQIPNTFFLQTTSDAKDTYTSLWRKIFRTLTITATKQMVGFNSEVIKEQISLLDRLPATLSPSDIRAFIDSVFGSVHAILVFDEFDRITDVETITLMADTIKLFSDTGCNVTVLIIGVAESVDELIADHQSIERALIQVPMPRMSSIEIRQIITNGLEKLGLTSDQQALEEIVTHSEGLPYIAHLLSLHSVEVCVESGHLKLNSSNVDLGIRIALDNWQQSVKNAYHFATKSAQPVNIYKHVLLACALAELDDFFTFSAKSVQRPLHLVTGKQYQIANYSNHLNEFSTEARGNVLNKSGEARRYRYRFTNPMIKPYIKMRGYTDGLLTKEVMSTLSVITQP